MSTNHSHNNQSIYSELSWIGMMFMFTLGALAIIDTGRSQGKTVIFAVLFVGATYVTWAFFHALTKLKK